MSIDLYDFLFEAPVDMWLKKNTTFSKDEVAPLVDKFLHFKDSIDLPDPVQYSFEQLQTIVKSIELAKSRGLRANEIKWLTKQIRTNSNLKIKNIEEDYIPVLVTYTKNKNKLLPLAKYSNIVELFNDLEKNKEELQASVSTEEKGILLHHNGWILAMPHTTAASCELGKGTTWCTARTDSQNLFLNYVARDRANIILFYVIKEGANPRSDPWSKLSVGFVNGEPLFDQGDGNVSVNANNDNLTQEKFERLLGKENAEYFLNIMQQKANSIEGMHPAKKELADIAASSKRMQIKLATFKNEEERQDFIRILLEQPTISPEVLELLSYDNNVTVRVLVSINKKTPVETLKRLANDTDYRVRQSLARNENIPIEVIEKLADDNVDQVRENILNNESTPDTILRKISEETMLAREKMRDMIGGFGIEDPNQFAYYKQGFMRSYAAANPETNHEILISLTKDPEISVRHAILRNPNITPDILDILSTDTDVYIRQNVAKNINTPEATLIKMLKDNETSVVARIAENTNVSAEILDMLSQYNNGYVRTLVAGNKATRPSTLAKMATEILNKSYLASSSLTTSDTNFLFKIALNPSTPTETLALLAKIENDRIHIGLVDNPSTPRKVLEDLLNSDYVAARIANMIEKRLHNGMPLEESISLKDILWLSSKKPTILL